MGTFSRCVVIGITYLWVNSLGACLDALQMYNRTENSEERVASIIEKEHFDDKWETEKDTVLNK